MKDLDKFKNEMNLSGQNVYVGHRYVPKIEGEWDNSKLYEPLSIVQYQGNSFTSRQYVPVGVEITNEEYWVSTGNYNAQIEQYRQDVRNLETNTNNLNDEIVNARNGETTLNDRLDKDKQDIIERAINVKTLGAKGDGVTDDTEILQQAIDLGFDEGYPVYVPNGKYIITKPLKVYGSSKATDTNTGDSTVLYGESRATTKFIKKTNETINAVDTNLNVDTIVLVTNRELDSNAYVNNVYLSNFTLESGNVTNVEYGLYMIGSNITASIFEKIHIKHVNNSIYTKGHNYLNEFRFIRMDYCVNGFDRGTGTHTSNLYQTMYVQGCTGTAFKISGNYVTAMNLHADSVTGTVFNFYGLQGTVISPGSESSGADIMFDFTGKTTPDYTACTVIGANTWPLNKENGVHIKMFNGTVTFIGGSINRNITDNTPAPSRLIEGVKGYGSLLMQNVKISTPPLTPSILPKSSNLDFYEYQTNNATLNKTDAASASQIVQASETIEVSFDKASINNSNLVNGNRFVIPQFIRKVRLTAQVVFLEAAENAIVTIRKEGMNSSYINLPIDFINGNRTSNMVSPVIEVNEGDEFYVEVINNGSSAITLQNRAFNSFSIEVIE